MILRTFTAIELHQSRLPWYLGRCYWKPETDEVVTAIMPLNFLIGWGYEAWWTIMRGPEGTRLRLEAARAAGFRSGLEAGEKRAVEAAKYILKCAR